MNPNNGGLNESEQQHGNINNPSKSKSPLVQFKNLKLSGLRDSLQSAKKKQLKHYTTLAGQLAGEGHVLEFARFLEVCVHSDIVDLRSSHLHFSETQGSWSQSHAFC